MSDEPPPSEENEVAQISVGYVRNLERRLNFIESKNNELQGAVQVLIEKSKKPASGMKIANPEYFKGDRLLLANFLSQCKLKFAGEPSKFPNDKSKIFFAGSYLREGPYSWFQPLLSAADNGGSTAEFVSFHAFSDALTTIYGDPNLVITSEREISQLRQTTSVAQYIIEFQRLRQYVKHNEAALIDQFYYGLRDNVKDKLVNGPRSETLAEMINLATSYDARIQERAIERRITPLTLSLPSRVPGLAFGRDYTDRYPLGMLRARSRRHPGSVGINASPNRPELGIDSYPDIFGSVSLNFNTDGFHVGSQMIKVPTDSTDFW